MRKKIDYKHLIENVCRFECTDDNYGQVFPTITAQQALNELCHYFLGDDWYEPTGQIMPERVNFSIVESIERQYSGCKIKRAKTIKR